MNTYAFEKFLSNDPSITSSQAIASRLRKATQAEKVLGKNLDEIVCNDNSMCDALLSLRQHGDAHGNMQNAVRKYYHFVNEKPFPTIKDYKNA